MMATGSSKAPLATGFKKIREETYMTYSLEGSVAGLPISVGPRPSSACDD